MKSLSNTTSEFNVCINYRYIRYFEDGRSLDLQIDPPGDAAAPAIVELPSSSRWVTEMPAWARERRDQIVQRIKRQCTHMRNHWEEY